VLIRPNLDKIRPEHLDRRAFVYIRQSTFAQVLHNTASTARQYDLKQRALDLGWSSDSITVIDQDQGRSGASAIDRDGFQSLLVEVGLGHAGAVLSLEASRLARSCSDWYRLLEICAVTHTLVIDEDGVYDPSQYQDRLLLGIMGAMSEAELHWLRNRLLGGKIEKAEHGELRFRPPAGLIFDRLKNLVFDPDEEVQHAVRLVFSLFDQLGSALAVVKHFANNHLRFPDRLWGKAHDGELRWRPLSHARVLSVLHNPRYAGAYVYGRTQTRTQALPGETPRIKGRTRQVAPSDWPIVRHNAHPGYLTWEQFLRNQQRLEDNRTNDSENHRGAVREGNALLQGIVLCGRCGRRMSVRYYKDGTTPLYECNQLHTHHAGPTCQFLRGDGVDVAVTNLFLQAIAPAELEVALATLEDIEARARQADRQWQLRLERVRYEADLARRRFVAVDPENRLVARTLEKEWNGKLAEVERLEREHATLSPLAVRQVSSEERQRILALAADVPALWYADTTTAAQRKQLLRLLIKDVTLTKQDKAIAVAVRWQTEACTILEAARPRRSCDVRRTNPLAVERIRSLASCHADEPIANILNKEGLTPGLGGVFTAKKVQWLRFKYKIASVCPEGPGACVGGQRGDGRYSVQSAAELLNINISTVVTWCKSGKLDGTQSVPHGPWWVRLTPEIIANLRKPTRQRWQNRSSG
jgi:DNA invertase Pin-like site-specific DNA recombinase